MFITEEASAADGRTRSETFISEILCFSKRVGCVVFGYLHIPPIKKEKDQNKLHGKDKVNKRIKI